MMKRTLSVGIVCLGIGAVTGLQAQEKPNKFQQLYQEHRTPTVYRTASGAPGHDYWQQRADYEMSISLDDATQRVTGEETITYHNSSPDTLTYLWVQLDQNMRAPDSDTQKTQTSSISDRVSFRGLQRLHYDFDGGFKIESVTDTTGRDLHTAVNNTMMRVDLPEPLAPGASYAFRIAWWYNINDRMKIGGRSGYEYFEKDDNYVYTIAQFFPRMAVYNEVDGWQHKQFLGSGEFTLPFGDYDVSLTVPSDHLVSATGVLQNPEDVLNDDQRARLDEARTASEPVIIASEEAAREREQTKATTTKTWRFAAENVRDFGFATSRKFIWDAQGVPFGDRTVMAMSFYPKEGNPLWEQYSTKAVVHTLRVYSKFTFDYPYPVAQSIHTDNIGMEYPMICFNGPRPEEDGTYSPQVKYGLISVIIHEVGHNYFPMIVNSDERQWTWMDEGLNSFLQYLAEQEWERGYPSRRGAAEKIVPYMKGNRRRISPIMLNSDSVWQLGPNAYSKPTTALNILRETVMGRELFDFAFKEYSQRWMFKHPTPEDFFRTMEDASAVDLDWFWRGWFYTTDTVDVSLDSVEWFQIDTKDPEVEKTFQRQQDEQQPTDISTQRNLEAIERPLVEADESLKDFYNQYDEYQVLDLDREEYEKYVTDLDDDERNLLRADYNYYEMSFTNVGGLVTPLILELEYDDGTTSVERIPAEIWRRDSEHVTKVFPSTKKLVRVTLDPNRETADVDIANNFWPARAVPTRFQLFKESQESENPMQRERRNREEGKKETTPNGQP